MKRLCALALRQLPEDVRLADDRRLHISVAVCWLSTRILHLLVSRQSENETVRRNVRHFVASSSRHSIWRKGRCMGESMKAVSGVLEGRVSRSVKDWSSGILCSIERNCSQSGFLDDDTSSMTSVVSDLRRCDSQLMSIPNNSKWRSLAVPWNSLSGRRIADPKPGLLKHSSSFSKFGRWSVPQPTKSLSRGGSWSDFLIVTWVRRCAWPKTSDTTLLLRVETSRLTER